MSIQERYRNISLGASVFVLWTILQLATETPNKFFLEIGPGSIFKLSQMWWFGIAVSLSSSLLAFCFAMAGGYIGGKLISSMVINFLGETKLSDWGKNLDRLFDSFYVIPLVLTLNLFYNSGLAFTQKHSIQTWVLIIFMIAITGMILGGYNIYKATYEAAISPKQESLWLVQSLYLGSTSKSHFGQAINRFSRRWISAKRLRDCEIHSFAEAIKRAFHLSIVSVIILESITINIYEAFYPQSGIAPAWLGGIGRMILTVRNTTSNYETIAGCIWVVLIFDFVFIWIISKIINRRWLKYHTGKI